MNLRTLLTGFAVALTATACGGETSAASKTGSGAQDAGAQIAAAGGSSGGIVIRAREGGKNPDRFCMPEWSIANETGADIGALLIQLEWRTRAGEVLQPVGEFGTMVEGFAAGRRKDMTLNGYTAACSDIELVARTYACRNADAVRMACPGPLRADAPGAVRIDLSNAAEGPMRGAVEAP
jgi:hypothetical protein